MRNWILAALTAITIGSFLDIPAMACELGAGVTCTVETGQAARAQNTTAATGAPMRLTERVRSRATGNGHAVGRSSAYARARASFRRARAQMNDKAPPSKENFPVRLFDASAEKSADTPPQAAPTIMQVPASFFPAIAPAAVVAAPPAEAPTATHVVAATEFNEIDRAAAPVVFAATGTQPSSAESTFTFLGRLAERLVEPAADQGTTAIGRMFVGFAVLLTVASALRLILA
jgi:hypothetical protein